MSDSIVQPKPVAFLQWEDPQKQSEGGGMTYGARAQGIPLWLRCREDSFIFSWIRAMLHPGTGPGDAQLLLVCPRCGQQLRIPGHYKTFQWEQLPSPRAVPVPGNPTAVNVVRITVVEPMGCPRCKQGFKLVENVIGKA